MYPRLVIDLDKVRQNTSVIVKAAQGLAVYAVTKGCAGDPRVAQPMLEGGAAGLADSRLPHLAALRRRFPNTPLMALRQPMRHEIPDFLALNTLITVSDADTAAEVADEAAKAGRRQPVVLMVEAGDCREGIPPESFPDVALKIALWPSVNLTGVAANVGCFGGRAPGPDTMSLLDRLVYQGRALGLGLNLVSAGNSSCWELLAGGRLARTANQMRFGEAILLGKETLRGKTIPGAAGDAFVLRAEVLECCVKENRRQLVIAVGAQDVGRGDLHPIDRRLKVTRITSDHTVISAPLDYRSKSGQVLDFIPSYFALQSLAATTYVGKTYVGYNKEHA